MKATIKCALVALAVMVIAAMIKGIFLSQSSWLTVIAVSVCFCLFWRYILVRYILMPALARAIAYLDP